jgi:hypothetical protein
VKNQSVCVRWPFSALVIGVLFLVAGCGSDAAAPGELGGACLGDGTCNGQLACVQGACESLELTCYTPCRSDLPLDDGTVARCSADGLMEGCLPGMNCVAGSCVEEGGKARSCQEETECPDFQSCIDGLCRSNCDGDRHCDGGDVCYKHVCRTPCRSDREDACQSDQYCALADPLNGHCMPLAHHDETSRQFALTGEQTEATAALSSKDLVFSPARHSTYVIIENTGDDATTYSLVRTSHQLDDEQPETSDVLDWVEIDRELDGGAYDTLDEDGFDLQSGERITLRFTTYDRPAASWSGTLKLKGSVQGTDDSGGGSGADAGGGADAGSGADAGGSADAGGGSGSADAANDIDTIQLTYSESLDGQWSGSAYHFGNFIDLSQSANQDEDQSALVRKFDNFTGGQLSFDEFDAIVTATITESWKSPSVRDICPESSGGSGERICYLYTNSLGYADYSADSATNPVPEHVLELPVALNLEADDSGLGGRIDSSGALHYPGDPAIALSWDDTSTTNSSDDRVLRLISPTVDPVSTIVVGGRYDTDEDGDCDSGAGEEKYPWLVPGFVDGATRKDGSYTRKECRNSTYPFSGEDELNALLAASNPVPDGMRRVRKLSVVRGVMVDMATIYLIFKEETSSLLDPTQASASYGLMVLEHTTPSLPAEAFQGNDLSDVDLPDDDDERKTTQVCSPELIDLFANSIDDASIDADDPFPANIAGHENEFANFLLDGSSVILGAPYEPIEDADQLPETSLEDLCWREGNQTCSGTSISDTMDWRDEHTFVHWMCRSIDRQVGQGDEPGEFLDEDLTGNVSVHGYFNQFSDAGEACPAGGEIEFFALRGVRADELREHSCNEQGTCHEVFNRWKTGVVNDTIELEPDDLELKADDVDLSVSWRCMDANTIGCTPNRRDPRQGKGFFHVESAPERTLRPLSEVANEGFRYRTQFQSQDGTPLGFAPPMCDPDNVNATPFCYSPEKITEVLSRSDCLMQLVVQLEDDDNVGVLDNALLEEVRDYLAAHLSYAQTFHRGGNPNNPKCAPISGDPYCLPVQQMGSERLFAELMLTLGDESYTQAFSSRFDLAGLHNQAFDGTAFEGDRGIRLSGGAGNEMFLLYQASQHYQLALERFYRMSGSLAEALEFDSASRFTTQKMVTTYFDRLIRASTQKGRAHSEIARKYMDLNRPQLARQVVERSYVASLLEFQLFNSLMKRTITEADEADRAQLDKTLEQTQRRYRMALLDMRNIYSDISDELTLFGFAPDYIPFPVLGALDGNSFERMYDLASQKLEIAASKEQRALDDHRTFSVDKASFQEELSSLISNYDNQLAELCGTVEGSDGTLYPAIARYAGSFETSAFFSGDFAELADSHPQDAAKIMLQVAQQPCGLFGTGDLFEARREIALAELEIQSARQAYVNSTGSLEDEEMRVRNTCRLETGFTQGLEWNTGLDWDDIGAELGLSGAELDDYRAEYTDVESGRVLGDEIFDLGIAMYSMDKTLSGLDNAISMTKSKGQHTDLCIQASVTASAAPPEVQGIANTRASAACKPNPARGAADRLGDAKEAVQITKIGLEAALAAKEREKAISAKLKGCTVARVESQPVINDLIGQILTDQIEILKKIEELDLARSRFERVRNQAKRLEAEYDESLDLLVNVEAARNDPNTRIYKNDAVINSDRTFRAAVREAYKATRVFEYYTGQSYAALEKLFLIRMVAYGDYSLEGYMADLHDAYVQFQEQYGEPDERVLILSMRDDLLGVPLYDEDDHSALSDAERDERVRQKLFKNVDASGRLVVPFSTELSATSPLTHNHKITEMRAEIVYQERTDLMARVYLRQVGTSTVRTPDGKRNFYRFPERTAVINPFFNGEFVAANAQSGDAQQDVLDPSIFSTRRLRERPLANSKWELVVDLQAEQVNRDLDLEFMKDIRLYIYYSDFTDL